MERLLSQVAFLEGLLSNNGCGELHGQASLRILPTLHGRHPPDEVMALSGMQFSRGL